MGAFGGLVMTNRGLALQAKAQAGAELRYTRVAIGDGYLGGQSIATLNNLINERMSLDITKLKVLGQGRAVIGTVLTNQGITTGFYFREIGIFALDPDEGEILYAYANAGSGAEYIPPGGGPDVIEKQIDIVTIIGNASNVSAEIPSAVYATVDQLEAHINATTGVHGATSAATPNTIVQRDPAGRFKAAAPSASDDVARKAEVDAITTEKINTTAYRPATEDGSTYPIGVTSFAVSNGLSDGWPTDLGVVLTTKLSHIRCLQIFMASSATGAQNGRVYVRSWRSDSGWSDWRRQWDSQEMGAGSGLDADLLDGLHASNFWTKSEIPYETGVWTPELRFGNETTGITYTDRFGRYTRIGNVVFWELDIILSSKGTATGDASIAGLPFASNNSRPYSNTVGGYANITLPSNATGMVFYIPNNRSTIFLRQIGNGIPVTQAFNDSHFANNSFLRAHGNYTI